MRPFGRTIGQLASAAGVGVETIRYYERRGLLVQPPKPAGAGYRLYGEEALRLLRYIRMAQSFGMSLRDVEALIARTRETRGSFCQAVRETAAERLAKVREELAALQALEADLESCLAECGRHDPARPCPILVGLGLEAEATA
ncbi:MAG: MerR family transcriptional regulator [Caulobacteraceae bacterium]